MALFVCTGYSPENRVLNPKGGSRFFFIQYIGDVIRSRMGKNNRAGVPCFSPLCFTDVRENPIKIISTWGRTMCFCLFCLTSAFPEKSCRKRTWCNNYEVNFHPCCDFLQFILITEVISSFDFKLIKTIER